MQSLASFVMRGRLQAVSAAALLAVLAWSFSLLGVLSAAVVALVTLRHGSNEGLVTIVLASLVSAVLGLLALGNVAPALATLALVWTPTWLIAIVLRNSRSLALAVQGGVLFGLTVIVVYHGVMPDPIADWREILQTFSQPLVEAEVLSQAQQLELVDSFAPWMTGFVAVGSYLQLVAGLMLARWWQATMFNPGGFREEFHNLRMHRVMAYIAFPVLVFGINTEMTGVGLLVNYVAMLLMTAYFLQGLAFVHGAVALFGASSGWLFGMYVLLILAMPNMFGLLFAAGYADAWFDFRARIRASRDAD
ncbi:FIG003573: hypothetical protein [hydrothermal vent metagenome]|uniref:DUF2232 domain-containing protein n=1 Tax=hydrothermal vent metagenome TaxID=652676 RepID=A0A3B1BRN0_9ZZZZ